MKFRRRTPLQRSGLVKAKRRRSPATRASRAPGPIVRATLLGDALELIYRHAYGGTYRHTFGRGARVSFTADGVLLIDGGSVKAFIE